jgi:hypothetical protein
MSDDAERLALIRHAYFVDHTGARHGLALFEAVRAGTSRRKLGRLLRYHEDRPISTGETWDRDHFDYLLAYFSMVEVACLAGYLTELPPDHVGEARALLGDGDVRRYYEDYYPIFLPRAHLLRVTDGAIRGDRRVGDAGPSLFDEFFALSQPLECGETVETFLWFLDGGWRGGSDIGDTIAVLRSPQRFVRHTSTRAEDSPDGRLDPLSASVQGFLAYVDFAPRLLRLLGAAGQCPVLQSAMWHFHGYWLAQMGRRMGAAVRQAFRAMDSWERGVTAARRRRFADQLAAGRRTRLMQERALAYLSSGRFSYVLVERLLEAAVAPTHGTFPMGYHEFDLTDATVATLPDEPDARVREQNMTDMA